MSELISRQRLKPCPFCGGDKIRLTNWGLYRCWCANCLAQAADEISEKDAVEAWNRRVEPPAECVPLSEVYRVIAEHSDYHGDNILAALTCIAAGKEVKPVKPLPADQWIPVTYHETTEEEREYGIEWDYVLDCPLPDNDTEILVCTKAGSVWTDTFFNDDGCYLDGGYDLTEIVAWMPLPEPYKGTFDNLY